MDRVCGSPAVNILPHLFCCLVVSVGLFIQFICVHTRDFLLNCFERTGQTRRPSPTTAPVCISFKRKTRFLVLPQAAVELRKLTVTQRCHRAGLRNRRPGVQLSPRRGPLVFGALSFPLTLLYWHTESRLW